MKFLLSISLIAFFQLQTIELTHFSATALDDSIKLKWIIERNPNVAYFKVERSTDNENYVQVARISAEDNYEFTCIDESPIKGESHYRLRMFEKDGKSTYSEPILIELGKGKSVFVPTSAKWRSESYTYE